MKVNFKEIEGLYPVAVFSINRKKIHAAITNGYHAREIRSNFVEDLSGNITQLPIASPYQRTSY